MHLGLVHLGLVHEGPMVRLNSMAFRGGTHTQGNGPMSNTHKQTEPTNKAGAPAWCVVSTVMLALASSVQAQSNERPAPDDRSQSAAATPTNTGVRRTRPVRKAIIDLEKLAKERRPGQVMPGDPSPMSRTLIAAPTSSPENLPVAEPQNQQSTLAEAPLQQKKDALLDLPGGAAPEAPASRVQTPATLTRTEPAPEVATPAVVISESVPVSVAQTQPLQMEPAPVQTATASELTQTQSQIVQVPVAQVPAVEVPAPAQPARGSEAAPLGAAQPDSVQTVAPVAASNQENMSSIASPAAIATPPATSAPTLAALPVIVDGAYVTNVGQPANVEAAKIRVARVGGDATSVQWRLASQTWRTPAADDQVEGRIDVRAGLDSDLVLVVDENVELRITRLGRATVERAIESDGSKTVLVTLSRGAIELRSIGNTTGTFFARVRTPDQMFGVAGMLRVEYDAFSGTRRRNVNR